MDTQGVLYIATGKKYIRAAVRSARSVRRHCAGVFVHLFADWSRWGFDFSESPFPFTSVEEVRNPHRRSKVDYLSRSPFDRTLYLDTDTTLNADVRGMFRVLDRFDLALAHAHRRNAAVRLAPWRVTLPDAFPQFNGGVILFRRTPAVTGFLEEWAQAFHEAGFDHDQRTLRELVWASDLRVATLPPEYNVRFMKYRLLWSREEAAAKILHLRRYHDGPFWLVKKSVKRLGRSLVKRGIDPRRWARVGR